VPRLSRNVRQVGGWGSQPAGHSRGSVVVPAAVAHDLLADAVPTPRAAPLCPMRTTCTVVASTAMTHRTMTASIAVSDRPRCPHQKRPRMPWRGLVGRRTTVPTPQRRGPGRRRPGCPQFGMLLDQGRLGDALLEGLTALRGERHHRQGHGRRDRGEDARPVANARREGCEQHEQRGQWYEDHDAVDDERVQRDAADGVEHVYLRSGTSHGLHKMTAATDRARRGWSPLCPDEAPPASSQS
jgi:hypothetical protein